MELIKKIKEHKYISAGVVYVCVFLLSYLILLSGSQYLFADRSDVVNFTYPQLVDLQNFYNDLLHGNFSIINYDRLFGIDIILNNGFIGNPLYLPVIFFTGDKLLYFFKFYYLTLTFAAGLSFIYMCDRLGKSPVAAAFVSPLYLFCPFVMNFSIWYYCYIPNFVFLPLMIVGMENIFEKKSGKMLTVVSFLTCICISFYFFVYNVVLTVLYALARVIFMKEDSFIKRLLSYGTKGGLSVIKGLLLGGIWIMPQIMAILGSGRLDNHTRDIVSELFSFGEVNIEYMFLPSDEYVYWGTLQALMIVMFLISRRTKGEHKLMFWMCISGIVFPVMSAALSGFTYIQHRWFYAFSLLCGFAAASVVCDMTKLKSAERTVGVFLLLLMELAVDYFFTVTCAVIVFALAAALSIPFIWNKTESIITSFDKKHPDLLVLIIVILSVVVGLFDILMSPTETIIFRVIMCVAVIVATALAGRPMKLYHAPAAIVTAAMFFLITKEFPVPDLNHPELDKPIYEPLIELQEETLKTEEGPVRFENYVDLLNVNKSGNYGLGGNVANLSLMPGRYMTMMKNSWFDRGTVVGVLSVIGFDRRLPYLSVFGIDYIQISDYYEERYETDDSFGSETVDPDRKMPFGFEKCSTYNVDGTDYSVYKNKYSLPLGFTYKNIISEEERSKLNGADYGINMLYGAVVEKANISDIQLPEKEPVTMQVGFSKEMSVETKGEFNNKTYIYELTPDTPIDGAEIYLSMYDIPYEDNFGSVRIVTDSGIRTNVNIYDYVTYHSYLWSLPLENYTIKVSHLNDTPVNKLTVYSSFEISRMELNVLKNEEFESRFNELNECTMKNVNMDYDRITGDISVPDTRMLAMSLQYDEGWTAYDNGVKVETYPINECMTGIMLSPGEHSIELRYHNKAIPIGFAVSLIGIAVLAVESRLTRKKGAA